MVSYLWTQFKGCPARKQQKIKSFITCKTWPTSPERDIKKEGEMKARNFLKYDHLEGA